MKISVVYDETHDLVHGKFAGTFEPKHVKEYGDEILRLAKIHKCGRFLNDMREAEIKLSITDLYYASAEAVFGAFDRSWKRAILVREITKELEFYEITASNKGLLIKVFDNYNEALEWL